MPVSNRHRKYNVSAKGQARRRHYEEKHSRRQDAEYKREYRRRLKEQMCTGHYAIPRLPAFRFLQAITTAEVIEI